MRPWLSAPGPSQSEVLRAVPDSVAGVLRLRGLRLVATHGVLAQERERAQPFEVDLEIEMDLAAAALGDDITSALDYADVLSLVEDAMGPPPANLLEHLALRVARSILASCDRANAVTVELRKLRPPVSFDLAWAAVMMRVTREAIGGRSPARAFLGLGSNIGDRLSYIRAALAGIDDLVGVSSLYETEPVGGPPDQGPYLNVVAELRTTRSPRELLGLARELESAAKRVRGERFGPRTLDVDVLLVGDEVVDDEDLIVPHPRMWTRRFVTEPLHELAPELMPRGWRERSFGVVRNAGSVSDPCC